MVYIMRRSFDIAATTVQSNWKKLNSKQSSVCPWEGRTGSSFSRKDKVLFSYRHHFIFVVFLYPFLGLTYFIFHLFLCFFDNFVIICWFNSFLSQQNNRQYQERDENRPVGIKAGIGGSRGEPTKPDNIEQYPYFTGYVKEVFEQHLFSIAMACKEGCLEEVHSAATIYWAYAAQ